MLEPVVRGDLASREFVAFWLRSGRLLAGMIVNVWDVTEDVDRLIRADRPSTAAAGPDPAVPLGDL